MCPTGSLYRIFLDYYRRSLKRRKKLKSATREVTMWERWEARVLRSPNCQVCFNSLRFGRLRLVHLFSSFGKVFLVTFCLPDDSLHLCNYSLFVRSMRVVSQLSRRQRSVIGGHPTKIILQHDLSCILSESYRDMVCRCSCGRVFMRMKLRALQSELGRRWISCE